MTQPHRLPEGGLIDRTEARGFTFDGARLTGQRGDTLASALLANGVHLTGRSFKYHRPRGILCAGPEEPNALVELRAGARREPNTRATTAELFDGLEARSQNRWPSLRFDAMAVNQLAAPLLGAGFYYKTFMWPASFWEKVYEPLIRRAAGLGRAAEGPDPDTYEKCFAHCDVLVIGAGPAGLTAAAAAACVVRWTAMALTVDVGVLAVVQVLHGVTFAFQHLSAMGVLARVAPGRAGMAQSVLASVGYSLSSAVVVWVTGRLYAPLGAYVFLPVAVMGGAALLTVVPLARALGGQAQVAPGPA